MSSVASRRDDGGCRGNALVVWRGDETEKLWRVGTKNVLLGWKRSCELFVKVIGS